MGIQCMFVQAEHLDFNLWYLRVEQVKTHGWNSGELLPVSVDDIDLEGLRVGLG